MQRIIYADELILINTIMTFIMLLTTRQFSVVKPSAGRLISASFIGGFYSLILLAPKMPVYLMLLTRTLLSIVILAFPSPVLRKTLKSALLFISVNYLYCGVCYAVLRITGSELLQVNNGFAYYHIGAGAFVAASAGLYCVIAILKKAFFKPLQNDLIYDLELVYEDRQVKLQALMDSGNQLVDMYTHKPVIVIAPEISDRIIGYKSSADIRGSMEKGDPEVKFRLLPVSCVNASVLLPAFTATKAVVSLDDRKKVIEAPSLAVSDDSLGEDRYQALIGATALR